MNREKKGAMHQETSCRSTNCFSNAQTGNIFAKAETIKRAKIKIRMPQAKLRLFIFLKIKLNFRIANKINLQIYIANRFLTSDYQQIKKINKHWKHFNQLFVSIVPFSIIFAADARETPKHHFTRSLYIYAMRHQERNHG
jgi:hypothetical protein